MHSGALTCMQPHLHGMHLHPIPVSSNPQPAAQENQVEPFYLIKQQDSVDPGRCPCMRAYSGACILLFYMTVHALAGSPVLPLLVSVRDGIRVVASGRVQADVHAFGRIKRMQAHLHGMHLHPIPLSSNPQPAVCNAQENQVEPFYLIKQQDSVHPGGCSCIRAYSGACILLFYMTVHALAGSPVLPLLVSVRDGVSLNISSSKISVASGTCTYFRPAIRHAIASRRICTALQTALRIPIFFTWPSAAIPWGVWRMRLAPRGRFPRQRQASSVCLPERWEHGGNDEVGESGEVVHCEARFERH